MMTQRHENDSESQTVCENIGTKAKAGRARRKTTSIQTTAVERAAEGQRRRRVFVRQAPIDDIECKSEPIDVSQQYIEELMNCGKTRTHLTHCHYDQILVKFCIQ